MPTKAQVRDSIIKAANEIGFPPEIALAVAARESNFNPTARNSQSIFGLYQMDGWWRARTGMEASSDPADQTRAFAKMWRELEGYAGKALGREPTPGETYVVHHLGIGAGPKALRAAAANPDQSLRDFASSEAWKINPHFARHGTVGNFVSSVSADIERRATAFNPERAAPGVWATGIMRPGMRGEQVSDLQKGLNDVLGTSLKVDGIYGPKTREAVRDLQSAFNLRPDGIFGPQTRAAFLKETEIAQRNAPLPLSQDTVAAHQDVFRRFNDQVPTQTAQNPSPVPDPFLSPQEGISGPVYGSGIPNVSPALPKQFQVGAFEQGSGNPTVGYPVDPMQQGHVQPYSSPQFPAPAFGPPMAAARNDTQSSFAERFSAVDPFSNDPLMTRPELPFMAFDPPPQPPAPINAPQNMFAEGPFGPAGHGIPDNSTFASMMSPQPFSGGSTFGGSDFGSPILASNDWQPFSGGGGGGSSGGFDFSGMLPGTMPTLGGFGSPSEFNPAYSFAPSSAFNVMPNLGPWDNQNFNSMAGYGFGFNFV